MMSAEFIVTAQAKNVQKKNYSAGFGDYCCIPECKSAFYTLNVIEKESQLALAYLSFRKIVQKREDG